MLGTKCRTVFQGLEQRAPRGQAALLSAVNSRRGEDPEKPRGARDGHPWHSRGLLNTTGVPWEDALCGS